MFDLERRNPSHLGVFRLHSSDDTAPFVAKGPRFVQFRVIACGNEPPSRTSRGGSATRARSSSPTSTSCPVNDIPASRISFGGSTEESCAAISAAAPRPSRMPVRSRGPPRSRASRETARSISGTLRSASRRSARKGSRPPENQPPQDGSQSYRGFLTGWKVVVRASVRHQPSPSCRLSKATIRRARPQGHGSIQDFVASRHRSASRSG